MLLQAAEDVVSVELDIRNLLTVGVGVGVGVGAGALPDSHSAQDVY